MTTHSPNVVRALPNGSNIVWMKDGLVEGTGDAVRQKMGWGVLDKRIILISEDQQPEELKALLRQWPDIDRQVTVWPVNGHNSLPTKAACKSLLEITGVDKIVLHRDGDFMTPEEREVIREKYEDDAIEFWITEYSDIEAYFLAPERIARVSGLKIGLIEQFFQEIPEELSIDFENAFSSKRQQIVEDKRIYQKRDDAPQIGDAREKILKGSHDLGIIHGKKFSRRLKHKINDAGGDVRYIFSVLPDEHNLALPLREVLSI